MALKYLALKGALHDGISISSTALAKLLGVSRETALRRLLALEEKGCIERKCGSSGQRVLITEIGRLLLLAEYQDYKKIFGDEKSSI